MNTNLNTSPSFFKNLDMSRRQLANGKEGCALREMVPSAARSLICLSGFTASAEASEFPFDIAGLPWIERYLSIRVKPYVRGWKGLEVVKVKGEIDGAVTPVDAANVRFLIAAQVLLQCLAQQHNILVSEDGRRLHDPAFEVEGKVRKFVRFGQEDSLVAYSSYIKHHAALHETTERITTQLIAEGKLPVVKRLHRQHWCHEDGSLVNITYKDVDTGQELLSFEVAAAQS